MGTTTTSLQSNLTTGDQRPSSAAHTPGPWSHSFSNIGCFVKQVKETKRGRETRFVATVTYALPPIPGEQEANARLIAAAPDLLAALKAMCVNMTNDGGTYRDCYKNAIKAIAKATSTEPGSPVANPLSNEEGVVHE